MPALRIILLSIGAAITYGIIHDQITARLCVEYFTIGHPQIIESDSPTVLAFFWGGVATWWVGLLLGTGLTIAARVGRRPKLTASQLRRPIGFLMITMFSIALLAGIIGYFSAQADAIKLLEPLATEVPADKHIAFLTVAAAHLGSYLSSFIGGITLWMITWKKRTPTL